MMNGEVVNFNFLELVADHYIYRGEVDNHNYLSIDGKTKSQIGLKSVQGKTWCPIRLFAFLVACKEVNRYLVMKYFLKTDNNFINFQKR